MNDFLIQFVTDPDARRLAALLRDRPGVSAHPVSTFEFTWGSVAIQPPAARVPQRAHVGAGVACPLVEPHGRDGAVLRRGEPGAQLDG